MRWLARLHDGLTRATFWIACIAVVYLTAVTALEVVMRYVFSAPTDWAPDTSAVSFAYVTFLAVPMLTRQGGHAAMTFIVDGVRPSVRSWFMRFTQLVGAGTCGLCGYYGFMETVRQVRHGVTMISVIDIPKWIVTAVVVYGLLSVALYFLRQFIGSFGISAAGRDGGR